MKKLKLIPLGALALGLASFVAYSNGAIASENSNNSETSSQSLVEDGNFFKNVNFEGVFDGLEILKDFSVPITEQEGVNEILFKYVGKLFRDLKGDVSISYSIAHNGDKLSFANFKVVEGNSNDKQGRASVLEGDCPDGLTFIKTCYSKDYVRETLEELGENFSDGETIYLHHDGLFGGVTICSDVR